MSGTRTYYTVAATRAPAKAGYRNAGVQACMSKDLVTWEGPTVNPEELAVEAAKKIKFKPAQIDGKPVTSFKTIGYSYSWDGGWRSNKMLP